MNLRPLLVRVVSAPVAWLLGLSTIAPAAQADGGVLRVLCWNIHHGRGADGVVDLERIARVIREARADVVALQEVDQRCRRSGGVDQTAELARLTGMEGRFGRAMDFDGGQYGQAVLTKHPLRATKVHALPGSGEPRIGFEAVLAWGDHEIRIVSLHLDLDAVQRAGQAKALATALASGRGPTLVCGDVNDTPGSAAVATLAAMFPALPKAAPGLSHPADRPEVEIDHVFARGLVAAEPVVVLDERAASDHRPLLVRLRRPTAAAAADQRIEPGK
jgi:endonuclease/exonuclease/phosphatase family metal-dependent hydrolase